MQSIGDLLQRNQDVIRSSYPESLVNSVVTSCRTYCRTVNWIWPN